MSIGNMIDKLIHTNVSIWHEATQIKKNGKPDHTLKTSERVKIFIKIRKLNALRSEVRWNIDSAAGKGSNETKINYHKGQK